MKAWESRGNNFGNFDRTWYSGIIQRKWEIIRKYLGITCVATYIMNNVLQNM